MDFLASFFYDLSKKSKNENALVKVALNFIAMAHPTMANILVKFNEPDDYNIYIT